MDTLFTVHRLNEEGMTKAQKIADTFDTCLRTLTTICPIGTREFAIVRTKLEEAAFFAKKAMATVPANQEEPVTA